MHNQSDSLFDPLAQLDELLSETNTNIEAASQSFIAKLSEGKEISYSTPLNIQEEIPQAPIKTHEETCNDSFIIQDTLESSDEETNDTPEFISFEETIEKPAPKKQSSQFLGVIRFGFTYLLTTGAVFWVLIFTLNFSAYSTIIHSYFNPEFAKESADQIKTIIDSSKIAVYANEIEDSGKKEEELANVKNSLVETTGELPKESVYDPEVLLRGTETSPQVRFDIIPYENRIVIPKIGKNIPLVDVAVDQEFDFDHMENIFMKELEKWVVRYPGTARPGELGNAFIFGHSSNYPWIKWEYNDVFALLDNLDYGDEIIVYYNQKKFVYTVNEKQVVRPGNVKVLERDETKKELSLMTCWPVGTTLNRMIVFAELTETSNQ